jgi:hypothetical protein
LGIVELPEVGQELGVAGGHEVDCHSLAAETARTTDSVDVLRGRTGKVVVDDQVHLLHVDPSAQQISRNKHSGRTAPELLHDVDSVSHLHVSGNAGHHELLLSQSLRQFVHTLLAVGEDHALGNCHVFVELKKSSELLAVLLHRNVELLDALQSQLLILHQDLHRGLHEVLSHLHNFWRHGGRKQTHLDVRRELLEDLPNDLHESPAQHFVGLVQDHHLQELGLEDLLADEIFDPAGSADDHLDAFLPESFAIFPESSASYEASGFDLEELAEAADVLVVLEGQLAGGSDDDGLAVGRVVVQVLEDADGEGGGFASSGLGLGNNVLSADDGDDSLLLDDRGLLEAECCIESLIP